MYVCVLYYCACKVNNKNYILRIYASFFYIEIYFHKKSVYELRNTSPINFGLPESLPALCTRVTADLKRGSRARRAERANNGNTQAQA